MPEVVYLNQTDLRKSMIALQRRGGPYQLAYKKALQIIEELRNEVDVTQFLTHNGESRIPHAVKYDLGHGCRLVTVQNNNFVYLLHVGLHEDADRWIERNAGLEITVNPATRDLRVIHISQPEAQRPLPSAPSYTEANTPFLKRIPGFSIEEWVDQPFLRDQLLQIDEDTDDAAVENLTEFIANSDSELGNFLFDLICEVKSGNLDAAQGRIEQQRGISVPVSADPAAEIEAVADETNTQRLANLSGMTPQDVERMFSPDGFRDWMLFLHPDQKKIAQADYTKPTVLTGVSGSGKTVVLIHRARYLARKYPEDRIGVVTLSRSLARLISAQLDELCKPDVRSRIHVKAFYDVFQELVNEFGPTTFLEQLRSAAKGHDDEREILAAIDRCDPSTFARESDPLSGEDLQDTWSIFIDQPSVQTQLTYFREHLENYQWGIDAENYLQEELSLLRSAFPVSLRNSQYPSYERNGRAIRLTEPVRKRVLDMLLLWEETMLTGGILDVLSLTTAVLPHLAMIRDLPPEKRYRCLLVDEFQDFSTLDLSLLRRLPMDLGENSLFLTGDPVQRVLVKDLRLGAVGLDIISATRVRLQRNYRNSRQILEAAYLIATEFAGKARSMGEEVEILDPELALRETAPPIIECTDPKSQIHRAWEIVAQCLNCEEAQAWSVTICTASPQSISTQAIIDGKPSDLNVIAEHLTGDYVEKRETVSVGTMAELKGFEFSLVVIVGCGASELPQPGRCKDEVWRDALRLYVAMTRARDSVYLIYSGEPSAFLTSMGNKATWSQNELPAAQ